MLIDPVWNPYSTEDEGTVVRDFLSSRAEDESWHAKAAKSRSFAAEARVLQELAFTSNWCSPVSRAVAERASRLWAPAMIAFIALA